MLRELSLYSLYELADCSTSCSLFGVTIVQALYYLWNYQEDRYFLKAFVRSFAAARARSALSNMES